MIKEKLKFAGVLVGIALMIFSCDKDDDIDPSPTPTPTSTVEFATIPGDAEIPSFEMGIIEVTNEQYKDFLNQAFAEGDISYDFSTEMVTDNSNDQPMIHLGGTRIIKDHNQDGIYELVEMESPINRCFIGFNTATNQFEIIDPISIDWNQYFDTSKYPNAVDNIDDWAELNPNGTGFFEEPDADKLLPTIEEIRTWPINHMKYYGAEGFARFYNYDLPTKAQWRYAGQGGQGFQFATSDGTNNPDVAWFNPTAPTTYWKGHAQPALSKSPNPYGVYNIGGGIWEWCKDWYDGYTVFGGSPKVDEDFFIDDDMTYAQSEGIYLKCVLGGSFNFFSATMMPLWNHAAAPHTGNDHSGMRVVKNL